MVLSEPLVHAQRSPWDALCDVGRAATRWRSAVMVSMCCTSLWSLQPSLPAAFGQLVCLLVTLLVVYEHAYRIGAESRGSSNANLNASPFLAALSRGDPLLDAPRGDPLRLQRFGEAAFLCSTDESAPTPRQRHSSSEIIPPPSINGAAVAAAATTAADSPPAALSAEEAALEMLEVLRRHEALDDPESFAQLAVAPAEADGALSDVLSFAEAHQWLEAGRALKVVTLTLTLILTLTWTLT